MGFPAGKLSCPVITLDLPGHGKSPFRHGVKTYSMISWCKDFKWILDTIGIKKINLAGYSMGGRLAMMFACYYPEYIRSMVVESATPGIENLPDRSRRLTDDRILAENIRNDFLQFLNLWDKKFIFKNQKSKNPEEYNTLIEIRKNSDPFQLSLALEFFSQGNQENLWDRIEDFLFPCMIIAGENDSKFTRIAIRMGKLIRHSSLHIIPGSGHTVHLEEPEIFCKILDDWLEINC